MNNPTLSDLGWSDRLRGDAADAPGLPARISAVARDKLQALSAAGPLLLDLPGGQSTGDFAVGDWVLYAPETAQVTHRLDRRTSLQRRSSGRDAYAQLIAANVDTLGIVTSCNADFNEARLERYLALSASGGCLPLIILTKADEVEDPDSYRRKAERLSPMVTALTLDAREAEEVARLHPWCSPGQTLALVGSSGVGKTTISNLLTGRGDATQGIREDDAKGRHTTTARSLHPTLAGGWLIDTPGMRELALADASDGVAEVFADLEDLAQACRFNDCQHDTEPGCAVQKAIAAGQVDADRLHRWQKLVREDAWNSASIAERHAQDRSREKMYAEGKKRSRSKRGAPR